MSTLLQRFYIFTDRHFPFNMVVWRVGSSNIDRIFYSHIVFDLYYGIVNNESLSATDGLMGGPSINNYLVDHEPGHFHACSLPDSDASRAVRSTSLAHFRRPYNDRSNIWRSNYLCLRKYLQHAGIQAGLCHR